MALRDRAAFRYFRQGTRGRAFGVLLGTTMAVVLVAGNLAFAHDPHESVISGCYDKDSGRLRVVAADRRCGDDERRLTWNERGRRGEPGPKGADGRVGSVGPQGEQGPVGPQGEQGPPGPIGPAGPAGAAGADGQPGPQGLTGAEGPPGPEGPQGPRGPAGPEGPAGPQGERGPAGISGLEIVTVRTPDTGLNSDSPKRAVAQCPNGKRVVGTAAGLEGDEEDIAGRVMLQEIAPVSVRMVRGVGSEVAPGTSIRWAITVVAFCAETSANGAGRS